VKVYAELPEELLDGWDESPQALSADQKAGFHYHDVEEWLRVERGEITFFTLGEERFHVEVNRALRIPRGEVHRAEAGPEGVEYRMFLPIAVPEFAEKLTEHQLDVLRRNLEFPDHEDGRGEDGPGFFDRALSDDLVFCRANGVVVDKQQFIKDAFVDKHRSSAGSVRVLNRTDQGLLISTDVDQVDAAGTHSFTNLRFLAAEGGTLRCRLWANYPQLAPDR
jgi:hypothetical protein